MARTLLTYGPLLHRLLEQIDGREVDLVEAVCPENWDDPLPKDSLTLKLGAGLQALVLLMAKVGLLEFVERGNRHLDRLRRSRRGLARRDDESVPLVRPRERSGLAELSR